MALIKVRCNSIQPHTSSHLQFRHVHKLQLPHLRVPEACVADGKQRQVTHLRHEQAVCDSDVKPINSEDRSLHHAATL